jgi:hypothetical protein
MITLTSLVKPYLATNPAISPMFSRKGIMQKQDCAVCLSAGSVGKSGVCEVCGEEVEDQASLVVYATGTVHQTAEKDKDQR